ncbi:MAG: class II glutamine amidotransferase [Burkholderiales bacterium]
MPELFGMIPNRLTKPLEPLVCQLLGMNCNVPTDIVFSLTGFQQRGGRTDDHADGWGIGFYEGKGCRLFLDPTSAANSRVAEFVRNYPIRSLNAVAHIRKATRGAVGLDNTHPFLRELWGRYWIFAHNGTLENYRPENGARYRPVGSTDSEAAFCNLLETLCQRFPNEAPDHDSLGAEIATWAARVSKLGTFNFLLGDGERLYAHCSTKLSYIERRAPFAKARLLDADVEVDFSEVTTSNDRVAVIATLPLTDNEQWIALAPGEFAVFHEGVRVN